MAALVEPRGARVRELRIVVVDDHVLVRQGLRDLLEPEGIHVVGDTGSAVDAVPRALELIPDVAVVDVRLADGTGIEVCRAVQSADPRIRCLLLTGFDDGRAVRAAVLAGAAGYVPKLIRDHDLANAIRRAAAGESLIAPERRAAALAGMSHEALATPLRAGLSPQERSVLDLMGQGMANREIAGELLIPEEAVSESVSAVLVKLGFDHRAPGAVLLARPPAVTG